jgi:hypothetical protein
VHGYNSCLKQESHPDSADPAETTASSELAGYCPCARSTPPVPHSRTRQSLGVSCPRSRPACFTSPPLAEKLGAQPQAPSCVWQSPAHRHGGIPAKRCTHRGSGRQVLIRHRRTSQATRTGRITSQATRTGGIRPERHGASDGRPGTMVRDNDRVTPREQISSDKHKSTLGSRRDFSAHKFVVWEMAWWYRYIEPGR